MAEDIVLRYILDITVPGDISSRIAKDIATGIKDNTGSVLATKYLDGLTYHEVKPESSHHIHKGNGCSFCNAAAVDGKG